MGPNIEMKEFAYEFELVAWNTLKTGAPDEALLKETHAALPLLYHDVIVQYGDELLLVNEGPIERRAIPVEEGAVPLTGLVARGVPVEDSIRAMVKEETGLDIENPVRLGWAHILSTHDPYGHGKGTDSFRLVYIAQGKGSLNQRHSYRKVPTANPAQRDGLHSYVGDFMDLAAQSLRGEARFAFREYIPEGLEPTEFISGFIDDALFSRLHEYFAFACHDVVIEREGGAFVITRKAAVLDGVVWPIGGRIKRGVSTQESMLARAQAESGLQLSELVAVGDGRTLLGTDPFEHERGTDTINLVYHAVSGGNVELDGDHAEPRIITPTEHRQGDLDLHPYTEHCLDLAMPFIEREQR